jgi:hypothetical protein
MMMDGVIYERRMNLDLFGEFWCRPNGFYGRGCCMLDENRKSIIHPGVQGVPDIFEYTTTQYIPYPPSG